MKEYKKVILPETTIIYFEIDNVKICFNETPGNRHYEEYLEWVAEGNTAEIIED